MTHKEVLIRARALIEDPAHWTKGTYNDMEGHRCAVGAIYSTELDGLDGMEMERELLRHKAIAALNAVVPGPSVEEWNDHPNTTHECVLTAFSEAIAREDE